VYNIGSLYIILENWREDDIIKKIEIMFGIIIIIITIIILFTMNSSNKISANTLTYLPLIKLSEKQMTFVENEWHHVCLSYLKKRPTNDNRHNSFDYSFEEIQYMIKTYGKYPDKNHYYWEELQNRK
jgi:hypothetical protein